MGDRDDQQAGSTPARRDDPVRTGRPFQIIALVKPFRAQAVLGALESVEILGGVVREAMGYGRQKNRLQHYLGSEYNTSFLPKVELTVFVEEEHVAAAVRAIVGEARTGRIGDGKILVLPCHGDYLSW
jgi:nitrogen regulatory protein PII